MGITPAIALRNIRQKLFLAPKNGLLKRSKSILQCQSFSSCTIDSKPACVTGVGVSDVSGASSWSVLTLDIVCNLWRTQLFDYTNSDSLNEQLDIAIPCTLVFFGSQKPQVFMHLDWVSVLDKQSELNLVTLLVVQKAASASAQVKLLLAAPPGQKRIF